MTLSAFLNLLLSLLLSLMAIFSASAMDINNKQPLRIATLDWTITETLIALGHDPIAVGDITTYQSWVQKPALSDKVIDLGLRLQPNKMVLSTINTDLILISPLSAPLYSMLSQIAPVETITFYQPEVEVWSSINQATLLIANLVNKTAQAEVLLKQFDANLKQMQTQLPPTPPLLLLQFIDDRHVRIYGRNSLFGAVIERLGLKNGWLHPTNDWGFSTVAIEQLYRLNDVQIVIIEPTPMGVEAQLQYSDLWQNLPFVHRYKIVRLPVIWSFGGILSAQRFANELTKQLLFKPLEGTQ